MRRRPAWVGWGPSGSARQSWTDDCAKANARPYASGRLSGVKNGGVGPVVVKPASEKLQLFQMY